MSSNSCVRLFLVVALFVTQNVVEAETPQAEADGNESFLPELAKFIDLKAVEGAIKELQRNIQLGWERERQQESLQVHLAPVSEADDEDQKEGNFMVVAVNELHKFKEHLRKEQKKYDDLVLRRQLADLKRQTAEAERKKLQAETVEETEQQDGNIFNSFKRKLSNLMKPRDGGESKFTLDDTLLFDGDQSEVEMGSDDEADEDSQRAKTYNDYVRHIQKYNDQLKKEKMYLIGVRTKEFIKSCFVDEAKDLAFLLLQQFITQQQVNLQDRMAKQLVYKLQMHLIKYLCGVLFDVLGLIFGRKVLPKTATEENSMNWMLHNMID